MQGLEAFRGQAAILSKTGIFKLADGLVTLPKESPVFVVT